MAVHRRGRSQAADGSGTTAEATATIQQAAEASEAGAEADDGCAAHHAPGTVAADNALDGRRSVIGGFYLSVADKPGVVRHVVDGSLGLRFVNAGTH